MGKERTQQLTRNLVPTVAWVALKPDLMGFEGNNSSHQVSWAVPTSCSAQSCTTSLGSSWLFPVLYTQGLTDIQPLGLSK